MGFRRERKTYNLRFDEDHELHGLEVKVRAPSLEEYIQLTELAESIERVSEVDKLLTRFAEFIEGWNYEDEDGEPIPPTYDSLKQEDVSFTKILMDAFMENVGGVRPPLQQSLNATRPSAEVSLPMEPLSGNPAN